MADPFIRAGATMGRVVDYAVLNENTRAFATELQGKLNEHNFAGEFISAENHIEDDAYARVWRNASSTVDPDDPNSGTPVYDSNVWVTISTYELECDDCALWVMAAAQVDSGDDSLDDHSDGLQLAIRLNGSIAWESATGTADYEQDQVTDRELGFPYRGMNTFGAVNRGGLVSECLVRMPAGRVVVELVAQVGAEHPNNAAALTPCWVGSHELIIVELRA